MQYGDFLCNFKLCTVPCTVSVQEEGEVYNCVQSEEYRAVGGMIGNVSQLWDISLGTHHSVECNVIISLDFNFNFCLIDTSDETRRERPSSPTPNVSHLV